MEFPRAASALVAVAFVFGLAVGGAAVLWTQPAGPPALDPANPPYSVSTATGCVGAPEGWAVTMPTDNGETAVVNLTVDHAPDETVRTALTSLGDGRYRFDVTTVDADKQGVPDCPTGSTVEFWGTFPESFASIAVTVDGETVGTVRSGGDGPTYRRLAV